MKQEQQKRIRLAMIIGTILFVVLLVFVSLLLDSLLPGFQWRNEALLSVGEIMEIMVAIFMALMLLYGQHEEPAGRTFWMSIGFISIALLTAFSASAATQCGSAWLYSLAGLIGGFWFSNVWLPSSGLSSLTKRLLPWTAVGSTLLIGAWAVAFCRSLPPLEEGGRVTVTAVLINMSAGLFFLAATCRFLIDFYDEGLLNSYLFACISLFFGVAALTFRHSDRWNAQWWFWQSLNFMAYIMATGFVFSDYLRTIRVLRLTIADYKQTSNALRENEAKFRSLFENSQDAIFITSKEGRCIDMNPAGLKLFGYGKAEFLSMNVVTIYMNPFDRTRFMAEIEERGFVKDFEVDYRTKNGIRIHALTSAIVRKNENNEIVGYQGIVRDVTAGRRIAAQLRKSLREKDAMLKEIHHRVKNNLQIISSLLNLQFENIRDAKLKGIFRESNSRIKSMALVHEELYRSRDLAQIDFAQYVGMLTSHLFRSFGVGPGGIKLKIDIEDIPLSIETAVPCGLMVNELVSNALKYAFPGREAFDGRPGEQEPEINVSLVRGTADEMVLSVGDNGIGFPPDVDFRRTESLGLQLVSTLTTQLGGTVELDGGRGTRFEIRFPHNGKN